jgi:hypothetical protein
VLYGEEREAAIRDAGERYDAARKKLVLLQHIDLVRGGTPETQMFVDRAFRRYMEAEFALHRAMAETEIGLWTVQTDEDEFNYNRRNL